MVELAISIAVTSIIATRVGRNEYNDDNSNCYHTNGSSGSDHHGSKHEAHQITTTKSSTSSSSSNFSRTTSSTSGTISSNSSTNSDINNTNITNDSNISNIHDTSNSNSTGRNTFLWSSTVAGAMVEVIISTAVMTIVAAKVGNKNSSDSNRNNSSNTNNNGKLRLLQALTAISNKRGPQLVGLSADNRLRVALEIPGVRYNVDVRAAQLDEDDSVLTQLLEAVGEAAASNDPSTTLVQSLTGLKLRIFKLVRQFSDSKSGNCLSDGGCGYRAHWMAYQRHIGADDDVDDINLRHKDQCQQFVHWIRDRANQTAVAEIKACATKYTTAIETVYKQ
jgi:hypothetical protein